MPSKTFDKSDITAAILAGGEGRRLGGRDKGLVEVAGIPLVAHAAAALSGRVGSIIVCANRNAEQYASFGRVVADSSPGFRGPLAGIAAALATCTTPWLLTVPVDVPEPPSDLASRLLDAVTDADREAAVAFEDAQPQPMFAIYRSRLAESAATALAQDLPVWQWQLQIRAVEVFYDAEQRAFVNLNNADEIAAWERAHVPGEQSFPIGLSLDAARALIVGVASERRLSAEDVAIETSLGRVLATDIRAPFDVPGFTNSAMDGYAVRGADLEHDADTQLRLIGAILAGGPSPPAVVAGSCVRITTGAILPQGGDTVVMKENTSVDGDIVRISPGTSAGANVRPAGEDYRAGELALERGTVLSPARVGALASFGMTHVGVTRRPRAVLLTTGDELVAPGTPLGPGQIHDSNRYSLGALLEQHGVALLRHERLRDEPTHLRDALKRAGADADIVISSGGVSAGEADYMPGLLAEVGKVHLWKVRIKPGMPFLFGAVGRALVFSLPGNPVSGIATFLALVKPALDALISKRETSPPLQARLSRQVSKRHSRVELLRAHLFCDPTGVLSATPLPKQGSGVLAGVAEANALIAIPEPAGDYAEGTIVDVTPLRGAFA